MSVNTVNRHDSAMIACRFVFAPIPMAAMIAWAECGLFEKYLGAPVAAGSFVLSLITFLTEQHSIQDICKRDYKTRKIDKISCVWSAACFATTCVFLGRGLYRMTRPHIR